MSRSPNTATKPMDGNGGDRHSGSIMDKEDEVAGATPDPISKQMAEAARKPTSGWSQKTPHLFHLSTWSPNALEGGSITGANEENFPILKGQDCSIYIARLEPNGVREPHWHPNAWEVNFVVSGKVKWSFLGPKASYDIFEAEQGDVVFIPRGEFHYFENASETEDLVVLVVFNTSTSEPNDDIGIVGSLSSIPADVLGGLFKVSPDVFRNIHHQYTGVVIFKKK
jgi:oxalate decarboxylase